MHRPELEHAEDVVAEAHGDHNPEHDEQRAVGAGLVAGLFLHVNLGGLELLAEQQRLA